MRHDYDALVLQALAFEGEAGHARRARRIGAFQPEFRVAVGELTAQNPALEDLADSFPALLFAYATGFGEAGARAQSIRLVTTGAPLRTAAATLALPMWLKRLPAAAFTERLRAVPGSDDFASRIHAFVPATSAVGPWLARVLLANEVCDAEAALWIARQYKGQGPNPADAGLLYLLAWMWHADKRETEPHKLMRRGWQPQISARRATEEVEHWRQRLALAVALGDGVKDTWLAEAHCRGYDFVALRTAEDFIAEAAAMDNCLDQYAHRLEGRAVRVFSVRRDGRSVADLEIACHEQELGMPAIAQLRAARNRRAGADIWQAAYAWLGCQTIRQADPELLRQDRARRARTTARLWRPFLETLNGETRALFAGAFGTRASLTARSQPRENRPRAAAPAACPAAASMRPRRRKAAVVPV